MAETRPEKKVYVTMRVTGKYLVCIRCRNDANTEDIMKKANEKWSDADFGVLSDIDGEAVYIEDDHGRRIWEGNR